MSHEQKQLLLQITELIVKYFELEMKDHWSSDDLSQSLEYAIQKARLVMQYNELYGELPKWNYIDDVWNMAKQLREELENEKMSKCENCIHNKVCYSIAKLSTALNGTCNNYESKHNAKTNLNCLGEIMGELAKFIGKFIEENNCPKMTGGNVCSKFMTCDECIKEWLQKENEQ